MEKLMYLAWLDPTSTRAEVSEVMLGRVPRSCSLSSRERLSIDVGTPKRHPAAGADPRGRDAAACAGLGLARRRRLSGSLRAGTRVCVFPAGRL